MRGASGRWEAGSRHLALCAHRPIDRPIDIRSARPSGAVDGEVESERYVERARHQPSSRPAAKVRTGHVAAREGGGVIDAEGGGRRQLGPAHDHDGLRQLDCRHRRGSLVVESAVSAVEVDAVHGGEARRIRYDVDARGVLARRAQHQGARLDSHEEQLGNADY